MPGTRKEDGKPAMTPPLNAFHATGDLELARLLKEYKLPLDEPNLKNLKRN